MNKDIPVLVSTSTCAGLWATSRHLKCQMKGRFDPQTSFCTPHLTKTSTSLSPLPNTLSTTSCHRTMPKTPRKPRAHTGYTARHIGRPAKRKSKSRFLDRFHSPTCEALCSNVGYAPEVVMSDITDLELLSVSWQKCSVQDVLVAFRKLVDSSFVNECVVCDMLFSRPYV